MPNTLEVSHSDVTDYVTMLIFDGSKLQSSEPAGPARLGQPRRTASVQDRRQAIAVILADPARSGAWSTDRDVGKFPRGIIHHRPLSLEFRCCKLVATSVGRRRLTTPKERRVWLPTVPGRASPSPPNITPSTSTAQKTSPARQT